MQGKLISRFGESTHRGSESEVILNESSDSVLEDGDINIPEIHRCCGSRRGLLSPNAVSWQKGMTTEDYIEKCGSLTQKKSGNARIIVIPVRTVRQSTLKM